MTREDYKTTLIKSGFLLDHVQMGYPSRGEEDVYTHRDYKYNFYVTRIYKDDKSVYGFLTGKNNGEILEDIFPSNTEETLHGNKNLSVWTDEAFIELMDNL